MKATYLHSRSYSIAHFLSPWALYEAFRGLRENAGAGVDKLTYQEYQNHVLPGERTAAMSRTFASRHANSTGPGNKTRAARV
jgi:hypothetical protein